MRRFSFNLCFVIYVVVQMLLCNYFRLTPYITLSILPALILCLPTRTSTPAALIIAFATGLLVDLLADGVMGLNTFALVAVAFIRKPVMTLVFGGELFSRKENFSLNRNGIPQVSAALMIVQLVFFVLYIWADSGGTRTFLFNFLRLLLSMIVSYILGMVVVDTLLRGDSHN